MIRFVQMRFVTGTRATLASALVAVGLWAVVLPASVPAQAPQPDAAVAADASKPNVPQQWKGAIGPPDAQQKLDVLVEFAKGADGALAGTLDVPMQGLKDGALSEITLSDREIRFTFVIPGAPAEANARFALSIAQDGRTAAGTVSQGGVETPVALERVAAGQSADISIRRPQDPQPPFPYDQRGVEFRNPKDGTLFSGTFTIPEGPGTHPAVVLLSGSGPQDRDEFIAGHRPFLVLSDHLSRHGIAVLRFDDRGVGGSGGSVAEATCEDLAEDAVAAIEALRLQPEVDPKRLGVIGHSEGGITGPMAAIRSPHISFVVMLAGTGLPGRDILTMQAEAISKTAELDPATIDRATQAHRRAMDLLEQRAGDDAVRAAIRDLAVIQITGFSRKHGTPVPNDAFIDGYVAQQMQMIQSEWFRSFLFLDPRKVLGELKVPVLALIGSLDVQVPAAANVPAIRKALEEGKNPDATVRELPGLNHLFQPAKTGSPEEYAAIETTIDPSVLELVTQWIRKRTRLDP